MSYDLNLLTLIDIMQIGNVVIAVQTPRSERPDHQVTMMTVQRRPPKGTIEQSGSIGLVLLRLDGKGLCGSDQEEEGENGQYEISMGESQVVPVHREVDSVEEYGSWVSGRYERWSVDRADLVIVVMEADGGSKEMGRR